MRYTLFLILFLSSFFAKSQDTVISQIKLPQKVYALTIHSGAVLVHNHDVQSIENAKPKGFSLDFSKQFIDSASYAYCRTYIRKGFSFSFYDLGTPILGNGFIGSYFLEPVYRIGNSLQFQFRGEMGLGYFTNPFDSFANPKNNNYSLHITPYLHVSAGFGVHLGPKFILEGNANFNHMSNGNYKEPNAGLNWSTFSAALLYYPGTNHLPKYNKPPRYKWSEQKAGLDVGVMFVPKQGYHRKWKNTRNYMAGIFLTATKKVSRISALSLGAEVYYNSFTDAPGQPADNSKPAGLAGIYIGHEFLFNKIIFSQQYGRFITDYPGFYKTAFFHRWGLRYRVSKHFYAGFNMKVLKFTADFIDFRVQYKLF